MQRPKNVIHILSALDGKITGPFMGLAATRTANREYAGSAPNTMRMHGFTER